MMTLDLDLGERSYPIYIGSGIINDGELIRRHLVTTQVMVVSNDTVAPLYLGQVREALTGLNVHEIILPDGECHKNIATWSHILDALLTFKLTRRCTLIALGGGVVGDMTGFAAACYQRGVAFLQMPTTLLAQVDASVGGKTGINHPLGKNMIGAFCQPNCVIIDTDTLDTLPKRELIAGLAEVIKYGLIRDPAFFTWLEANLQAILARDPKAIAQAIESSCRNKASVVAADEREAGQRALLNLGHTFGHAIETGLGYGTWLHGEAVAAGMCMAAELSWRLGWLKTAERDRIWGLITQAKLPTKPPNTLSAKQFLEIMAIDKKVLESGNLRLVLLTGIGQALVTDRFDSLHLERMLNDYSSVPT
jgi:3-dehydroquinate synthase